MADSMNRRFDLVDRRHLRSRNIAHYENSRIIIGESTTFTYPSDEPLSSSNRTS